LAVLLSSDGKIPDRIADNDGNHSQTEISE